MGIFAYTVLPVRYEAVAEVLMLQPDSEALSALADESIRWSRYDALKGDTLTAEQWEDISTSVQRYGNTSILLVKAAVADAELAADAANALANTLIDVMNQSTEDTALKSVVRAGVPQQPIYLYREGLIAAVLLGSLLLFSLISLWICKKNTKLIRPSDIADAAALPLLAEIPDLKDVSEAFLRFDPEERPALYDFAGYYTHEQLRLISLALRQQAKQNKLQSVALVSGTDDECRSELLVMLAQELCRQGSRVLLVDMNWFAPRLGTLLQAKGEYDLIQCLASSIPL